KNWLGISPDRLYVTVHHTDDEARQLWREVTGVPEARIYGLGDEDNFWQMADTGPAGPNSEIYVDLRSPRDRGARRGSPGPEDFVRHQDQGTLLEIGALEFMHVEPHKDGSSTPHHD